MRPRLAATLALLASALVAGCGDDREPEVPPSVAPPLPASAALSSGKSLLELEEGRDYRSPAGFEPQLRWEIPGPGWVSTHRGADGFDIGQPVSGVDAALVVVAFLTPVEDTAREALHAVEKRARAAGATNLQHPGAGEGKLTLHLEGGQGPLVASRDGGIALDAVPAGYVDIEALEYDDGPPVLVVTWVPDVANLGTANDLANDLVQRVRPN
jgi:hypothetical protein